METVRLQKYFTDCGVLSRRAAEAEIAAGRVFVNGKPALIGQKIDPEHDLVEYNGQTVRRADSARHTVLLHKPRGIVTTLSDEKGRCTVADLVAPTGLRLYPIGRLDMDSDGLLLLTDDGELADLLTHPRHEIPKYYRVRVAGSVTEKALARLNGSFLLEGYRTRPARVTCEKDGADCTELLVELYEGRNRQIRKMCAAVGLEIQRLTRIAIGKLTLGDLPAGHYRFLTPEEVDYLKGTKI